ncbi:MAG: potassium/proton antiporter [Ignavibacteriales bacterium]|nr:MAG: potassium/proton antiporter [Ignavibacteriales bacterium]
MIGIDYILLITAILVIISILTVRVFANFGIPMLILFIGVGILAGSEGLGGIYFNDAALSQSVGIIALIFILFAGGLDTNWSSSKKILLPALSLATVGVLLTALIVAFFVSYFFNTTFLFGLLIGSIVSSTDASAVFSILRIGNVGLKGSLKPLLELESGSNDPMAVFLTIGTIELLLAPDKNAFDLILLFILQIGIGTAFGLSFGKLITLSINTLKFSNESLYIVFALALCIFTYAATAVIGGSGFLAVYISGIIIGNSQILQKKGITRFFEGLAFLSQVAMFLTLGLLVFPSQILEVIGTGLLISLVLIFVARPISIFLTMIPFKFNWKDKLFISWVGLRGAVPIILATFPLLAGVEHSDLIFNIVFFIVLTSALLQGWSINPVARFLKLASPLEKKKQLPLEFTPDEKLDTDLIDFIVSYDSTVIGKQIVDLGFPSDSRIVLIYRNEKSIVPSGGTLLEAGDTVLILVNKNNLNEIKQIFTM